MDRNLALEFVRVTEEAAIAAARWMGKGDKNAADQAAVTLMRKKFDSLDIDGTIVIGEGEIDEAPLLYQGEKVGNGKGPKIDIAVDPLECTDSVAYGRPNAISVFAAGPHGTLLGAPDSYMNKIAVGPAAKGKIDLDWTPAENIKAVAKALGKEVEDVTVVVLDRERHQKLIQDVRNAGARLMLITDGDIAGGIATCLDYSEVDLLLGVGKAPEGVITAAALKCMDGEIQGRFTFKNEAERKNAIEKGLSNTEKKYYTDDLAKGDDVMFAATGIATGLLLEGIKFTSTGAITHSLVMRSKSKTIRFIKAIHHLDHEEHKKQVLGKG